MPVNTPSAVTASFFLKVEIPVGQRLIQTITSALAPDTFSRIRNASGIWSSWVRIDNFGCSTASELASLLGDIRVNIDSNIDLDDCTDCGKIYVWGSSQPQNSPAGYGSMVCEYFNGGVGILQTCIIRTRSEIVIYKRYRESSTWGGWFRDYNSSMLTDPTLLSPLASALKPYL